MFANFEKQKRKQARWCSLAGGAWAVAIFIVFHAWPIDPAAAQSPTPQAYRIGAGDKIGVVGGIVVGGAARVVGGEGGARMAGSSVVEVTELREARTRVHGLDQTGGGLDRDERAS